MDNKYPSFLWYEFLNSSHKNNANGKKRNAKTIAIYNGLRNFADSLFFVISPIYSIKYIIYHITILIIHHYLYHNALLWLHRGVLQYFFS